MNQSSSHRELFRSCEILFGRELHVSADFLDYLQESGVKSAFRRRAMETHPDRQVGKDLRAQSENTALFYSVRQAYENLLEFLREKETRELRAESAGPSADSVFSPGAKTRGGHAPHNGRNFRPDFQQAIKPIILTDELQKSSGLSSTEKYYHGPLPDRQLLFGHFLYYSGLVNWRIVTRILTWQRTERPRLGELGQRFGIFDQEDISTIMRYKKPFQPFGLTARVLGMLNEQQLRLLIFQQQRLQKKFGTILVEKHLLNDYELHQLLYQFKLHNSSIPARRGN
jgi:hypothetical protein